MVDYRLNSHYKYWTLITLYNKVHKSLQVFSDFRDVVKGRDTHMPCTASGVLPTIAKG